MKKYLFISYQKHSRYVNVLHLVCTMNLQCLNLNFCELELQEFPVKLMFLYLSSWLPKMASTRAWCLDVQFNKVRLDQVLYFL